MEKKYKKCPICGEKILENAIKCRYCGEFIQNEDLKECPFCKENIPKTSKVCPICESNLFLKEQKEIPNEIKKWNWGAFWFTWVWGIANNSYKTFLVFIPFFGFIWTIVCGIQGNKWAWENKKWDNVIQFNKIQYKWACISNVLAAITLFIIIYISACVLNPYHFSLFDSDETKINKAIYVYKIARDKDRAKDYNISLKCYKDIKDSFDNYNDSLVCTSEEKRNIFKEMNAVHYLDDAPRWGNCGMPKPLVLQGVPIMCYEKANMGDNSMCSMKQLKTIENYYKKYPNASDIIENYEWMDKLFE